MEKFNPGDDVIETIEGFSTEAKIKKIIWRRSGSCWLVDKNGEEWLSNLCWLAVKVDNTKL